MHYKKAVLFDYGNVLCMPQLESDLEAMARCCAVELKVFQTLYWQFRDEYDVGSLNGKMYWTKIASHFNKTLSEEQVTTLIKLDNAGWSRPNEVMAKWAAQTKAHNFKTAILSNMPVDMRVYLKGLAWLPDFDHYTFSCDINAVKPDHEIYRQCLIGLGVTARDALFIDDRQMNVAAAHELGIDSVVFSGPASLTSAIALYGLPAIESMS